MKHRVTVPKEQFEKMQSRVKDLEAENAKLKSRGDNHLSAYERERDKVSELTSKYDAAQSKAVNLQRENARLKEDVQKRNDFIDKLGSESAGYQSQVADLREALTKMKSLGGPNDLTLWRSDVRDIATAALAKTEPTKP
jgi:chromosome segregation ATPase